MWVDDAIVGVVVLPRRWHSWNCGTGRGGLSASDRRRLIARGAQVRALVRNPDTAAAQLGGVPLAVGDLDDAASLRSALVGIDRVFLTTSDGPAKVAQECAAIDAAASADVELVVKLSALHAHQESPLPLSIQ